MKHRMNLATLALGVVIALGAAANANAFGGLFNGILSGGWGCCEATCGCEPT